MTLTISEEQLAASGLTPREWLTEFACWLFDTGRLALWPAAQVACLSQVEFEIELRKRNIAIYRPTLHDVELEAAALSRLGS